MMKDIKFVAMDLDGTLTNSNKDVTPRTRKALDELRAKGTKIVLASGRPHIGINKVAKQLEISEYGGFVLSYNGGQIVDALKDECIYRRAIDNKCFKDICETSHIFSDVHVLTYDDSMILCEDDEHKYVKKEAFNCSLGIKKVADLFEVVKDQEIVKFEIVGEHEDLEPVRKHLNELYPNDLAVYYSEPYFLEVVAPGISKDTSLDWLLKNYGCTKENLVAIGDGLNDLSMLGYAGYSVAMENAVDKVKDAADYITASNDEDGVAKFIEENLLC